MSKLFGVLSIALLAGGFVWNSAAADSARTQGEGLCCCGLVCECKNCDCDNCSPEECNCSPCTCCKE